MLKYVSQDDHIDSLNFSPRAYNALLKHGVSNVQMLLAHNEKSLGRIKNLGQKSVQEILDKISEIQKPESEYFLIDKKAPRNPYSQDEQILVDQYGKEYADIPLHELGFSVRTYNCLKKENLLYLSDLYKIESDKLLKIPHLGNKSLLEIEDCKKRYTLSYKERAKKTPTEELLADIFNEINNDNFFQFEKEVFDEIRFVAENYYSDFENRLCSSEIIKDYVKKYIVLYFQQFIYGSDNIENLIAIMPTYFKNNHFIDVLLSELIDEEQLTFFYETFYISNYPSCVEGTKEILSEREYEIFLARISGQTLEEVGEKNDRTRQAIALVESKILKKLNKSGKVFQEDLYKQIFLTYDIIEEDFTNSLGDRQVYYYLYVRYKKRGKAPLEEILTNDSIPDLFKRKIEKVIYKDYVYIGSSRIKCTKNDLLNYAIRTFANTSVTFGEFKELYSLFLTEINKEHDESLQLMDRGFENILLRKNVLLAQGKKIRYYNFDNFDFTLLLESLDLEHFQNLRYSALKFFRENSELMNVYDIRNEYELHYLLRKICTDDKYAHIDFRRMPNMDFGNVDFDGQIFNLLQTLAPISKNKFVEEFEKEYGIKARSLLAVGLEQFNNYVHAGVYKVDYPLLAIECYNKLAEVLVKDFYTRSQLEECYRKLLPNQDLKYLNPYSIKILGYKLFSNYLISLKYETATDYYNNLLTKDDIVEISSLPHELKNSAAFYLELRKLKNSYEIIEFYPQKLINIRKLNEASITKTSLANYRNEILRQIKDNSYFTVHSLRKQGVEHELDELGFDDWFYASIFIEDREQIKFQNFTKNRLLYKGKSDVKLSDFIEDIIEESGRTNIEILGLVELIKENYNLTFDTYKIRSIVADSSLYYDQVSDKIYLDYNTYFKEI